MDQGDANDESEPLLQALHIPYAVARDARLVGKQIREALTYSHSLLSPVALLLSRDLMED